MHSSSHSLRQVGFSVGPASLYRLSDPGSDDGFHASARSGRATGTAEDLPYRVELWDEAKRSVEQVLAVTANGSIGYAAYYAATRDYPQRYVTLRDKNGIISRWNGPKS